MALPVRVTYQLAGVAVLADVAWLKQNLFDAAIADQDVSKARINANDQVSEERKRHYRMACAEIQGSLRQARDTLELKVEGPALLLSYVFEHSGSQERAEDGRWLWLRAAHEDLVLQPFRTSLLSRARCALLQTIVLEDTETARLLALNDAFDQALSGANSRGCKTFTIEGED